MGRIPQCRGRILALVALLVAGCATQESTQLPICPGKASAEDALAALSARAEKAVPLRASGGQCRLTYYIPDEEKPKRHNLSPRPWFNPPSELYMQLSIAVDPKALIIGCNAEEFWLALRPKEISTYYWGQWDETENVEGLMVSPKVVLEAFGIVLRHDRGADSNTWSLTNEGSYDVLTEQNETGRLLKRVHIFACDYVVHKIEYFDDVGKVVGTARSGDYEPVAEGFDVPTEIYVSALGPDGRIDEIEIKLASLREKQLSEAARRAVFVRNPRDMEKLERGYRYEGGRWVRER